MTKFIGPYDPLWRVEFENLKQVLELALGDLSQQIDIQHVGSTAIQGLYAKPILDIDIIIKNEDLISAISSILENNGYISKGEQGIPGRFAFRQSSDLTPSTAEKNKWQSHHLYVCFADSLALKNHLLFRDALRNDNDLVEKYSELKKSLTDDLKITRNEYTVKKTEFIISVLEKAGLAKSELEVIRNANTM